MSEMETERTRVAILDPQPSFHRFFESVIDVARYRLSSFLNCAEFERSAERPTFDLVICDVEFFNAILLNSSSEGGDSAARSPRIIVTAVAGGVTKAVECMKRGALDFLLKPTSANRMLEALRDAVPPPVAAASRKLRRSVRNGSPTLIANSAPMIRVSEAIERYARSNEPVFVFGETGTGKEMTAQRVHEASDRAGRPFVALNCAAIPPTLIESEIFGHVKGAYTGATTERLGAAGRANGGTLFLDEICEMDISLQSKFLRFCQEGSIRKVGSDRDENVDVRFICATNKDPALEVAAGRFRQDLLYRLDVLRIDLPSLRQRGLDVLVLAEHFIAKLAADHGREPPRLTPAAKLALMEHDWPGNIRELQNVLKRAIAMSDAFEIGPEQIVARNTIITEPHPLRTFSSDPVTQFTQQPRKYGPDSMQLNIMRPFDDVERDILEKVIELSGGSIPKAAHILSLSPSTIYRKQAQWKTGDVDKAS